MDKYYHVATHEDMDALMRYFDERGYMWGSGESPSSRYHYNYDIVCADDSDHTLTWMRHDNFVEYHQDETLIETCAHGNGIAFDGVYCAIKDDHPSAIRPITTNTKAVTYSTISARCLRLRDFAGSWWAMSLSTLSGTTRRMEWRIYGRLELIWIG